MRLGLLTGGGDCPGLNAAIRGAVYRANRLGHETVGFLDGWKGLRDGAARPLAPEDVQASIVEGGTLLGSSRTNPFRNESEAVKVEETIRRERLDGVVAIGGDDTLGAGWALARRGGHVVGVPKTMDNDVSETDWTFGFDSAATVSMEAVERLRDTARSHHRAVVLEVMGRHAGWVALATGLAAAADATLLPEEPFSETELLDRVRAAVRARGYAVVVASEGIDVGRSAGAAAENDEFGHALLKERGVGAAVAARIEAALGIEARSAQIGHIQRGGPPTLFDRILATRLGVHAVDLAHAGRWGQVAVLRGERVEGVPFERAVGASKRVDAPWLDLLHTFDAR
ncbi:MAG TPA: ATP-dependent 6-phosphofructokinase [Thermoplasmata archaeon]|nr:ATP-dependent 6-phosphofructokinase [Thermoplasmata archaeon]